MNKDLLVKPKRILIADDDPRVLLILNEALKRMDGVYKITTAGDGSQALKECQKQPFDLLITDIRMPEMDGVELVDAIRTLDQDTAVIWITAFSSQQLQKDCSRLKVNQCLDKPLRINEIRQAALQAMGEIPLSIHAKEIGSEQPQFL